MESFFYTDEFIERLEFEYIETYSFQRGSDFEKDFEKVNNFRVWKVGFNQKKKSYSDTELEKVRELEKKLHPYLLNGDGVLHYSAEKKGHFKKEGLVVKELREILTIPTDEVNHWMCAPFYRDAVVFYDENNQIVDVLNVCLSCDHMFSWKRGPVDAGYETYQRIKQFFIDIGHQVKRDFPTSRINHT